MLYNIGFPIIICDRVFSNFVILSNLSVLN